jgi:sortase A
MALTDVADPTVEVPVPEETPEIKTPTKRRFRFPGIRFSSPLKSSRSLSPGAIVLLVVGLAAAWFVLDSLFFTGLQEQATQSRLYGTFRSELAQETAPLGGAIKAGSPVALISAPAAGITNLVVVEGTTSRQTAEGGGHLVTTPLPGQAGVSYIFGRSVTFGGPFGSITDLRPGDTIKAITQQGTFTYRVTRVRYPGSKEGPPLATGKSQLTLVTSAGTGWRDGWAPEHAVYVDSVLSKGSVQPAPAGRPTAVTGASVQMHGDTGVTVDLVFWLEALIVVEVALFWCWTRWGKWKSWITIVPLLVAVLWGLSATAQLLLPNLY